MILSHLNTYLNDRDWRLKCSFFETIVGVAVYVGSTNLEEFILPLMVQALTDPEAGAADSLPTQTARKARTYSKKPESYLTTVSYTHLTLPTKRIV